MTFPRLLLAGAAASALALAGCASATNGTATSPTAPPPTTSSSNTSDSPSGFPSSSASSPTSSESQPSGAFPSSATALGAFLVQGTKKIRTAHITLDITVAGQTVSASGDEKLKNGKATSLALVERIPSVGTIELRIIDTANVYIKSPQHSAVKPWTKVGANTTDPTLRQIYLSLQNSQSFGSLESVNAFISAASDFAFSGHDTIGGDAVGVYSFTVDVTKLPDSFPNKSQLSTGGITEIPVTLTIDDKGRVRAVTDTIVVGSVTTTAKSTLSKFNQPVTIEAPPASQTSTS